MVTATLMRFVENQDVARAAVLGGATLLATLPLFMATRWMRGAQVHMGVANRRLATRTAVSAAHRWVTRAVLLVVIGLGVLIPIATMGFPISDDYMYAANSITDMFEDAIHKGHHLDEEQCPVLSSRLGVDGIAEKYSERDMARFMLSLMWAPQGNTLSVTWWPTTRTIC